MLQSPASVKVLTEGYVLALPGDVHLLSHAVHGCWSADPAKASATSAVVTGVTRRPDLAPAHAWHGHVQEAIM